MFHFAVLFNLVLFTDIRALALDYDGSPGLILRSSEKINENTVQPAEFNVKYLLYTRANRGVGQEILVDADETVRNSNFDESNPTRFIIHGWKDDAESISNILVRSTFLDKRDFNIFAVDWSNGTKTQSYVSARNKVKTTASCLADFIIFLKNAHQLNLNSTYLVGHNLGAHVAGIVGKLLKKQGFLIQAIIGLDPALPLYSINRPESRLAIGDASYVQTIHTSAARIGFHWPIGDAAFYPNWGLSQPACSYDDTGRCSDVMAVQYFALTLDLDNNFLAKKCENFENIRNQHCRQVDVDNGYVKMGGDPLDTSLRGVFYLPVEEMYPFAVGEFADDD